MPFGFHAATRGLEYVAADARWYDGLRAVFAIAALVLLVPGILIGAVFPILLAVVRAADASPGRVIGRLLAVNTAGAIAGALVAGFFLIDWLGLWGGTKALGLLYFAAAAAAGGGTAGATARKAWPRWAPIAALLLFATLLDPDRLPGVRVDRAADEVVHAHWESAYGVTAVVQRGKTLRLKMDSYYALGGTGALSYEPTQAGLAAILSVGEGLSPFSSTPGSSPPPPCATVRRPRRAAMKSDDALPLEQIRLGDPLFYEQPPARIEAAFAFLRREHPVTFHEEPDVPMLGKGPGFWALTRHADVLHVSRNPATFCSSRGGVNIVDQPPQLNEFFGSMIVMDDPRHTRLRRIVSRGFTPGMLRKAEADVDRAAAAIVDGVIDRGQCDFVADIAAALPLKIICDMMGIPDSEYGFVFERTNLILGAADPEYVADLADAVPAIFQAGQDLAALMADLARVRRERPTDDLTSALVHADVEGERLSEQEIGSFFILLVVAGNETTRNAISHGMKALCDFPDERRHWADDFERLAPTAVEEIVRWATPVTHFRRTATHDTEIAGQPIRADEKVVMFYGSANRDEAVFDQPDRLDLRRSPNEHVGFGGPGPHFCLGAHLARREITVMFRQLLRRLPDLHITGEPVPLRSFLINGIKRMPCAFTPGGAAAR